MRAIDLTRGTRIRYPRRTGDVYVVLSVSDLGGSCRIHCRAGRAQAGIYRSFVVSSSLDVEVLAPTLASERIAEHTGNRDWLRPPEYEGTAWPPGNGDPGAIR